MIFRSQADIAESSVKGNTYRCLRFRDGLSSVANEEEPFLQTRLLAQLRGILF